MEVVIDQKGEETVIKIKGRLDTNTARRAAIIRCTRTAPGINGLPLTERLP